MPPVRGLLCTAVLLVVIAGCGDDNATVTTTSTPTDTVPAEASPSVPKPEKLVVVHESEFKLDPVNATGGAEGIVKIKVVNDGKINHSLSVNGPNGRVDLDGDVAPGSSTTFEVDLDKPGTYAWYCTLDHHRANGMNGSITVGGSSAARGSEGQ